MNNLIGLINCSHLNQCSNTTSIVGLFCIRIQPRVDIHPISMEIKYACLQHIFQVFELYAQIDHQFEDKMQC